MKKHGSSAKRSLVMNFKDRKITTPLCQNCYDECEKASRDGKWVKAMVSYRLRAKVHYVLSDEGYHIPIKTLCGKKAFKPRLLA